MNIRTKIRFDELRSIMRFYNIFGYVAVVCLLIVSTLNYIVGSYSTNIFLYTIGMIATIGLLGYMFGLMRKGIKMIIDEDEN